MCVFARHNVLTDPPFSRLDLIVCRNLMIYVDAAAQAVMVSRFHYALNPGGFLWLGPSESLYSNAHRFNTIDRHAKIFKRDDAKASISVPFLHSGHSNRLPSILPDQSEMIMKQKDHENTDVETETEQAFLSRFAAPFLRISFCDEVIYASEAARQFLRPSKGTPDPVFDAYVVEPLRMPLRMILKDVRHNKSEVVLKNINIKIDGEVRSFDLCARPLDQELKSVLIAFQPVRWNSDITNMNVETYTTEAAYEAELAMVRKRLVSREREFKMAEQELWASNEELLTINEELQSSNEELESAQEELRSVNVNLELANAKLSEKNKIINASNNNLKNLIESVDLAIMFIDRSGILRLFTPKSKELFSVQDRDIGRSIFDLTTILNYPEIRTDLSQSERTLSTFSREVSSQDGRRYFIVKIRPYFDAQGSNDGVVVSFFEITEQREQQWALQLSSQQLSRRILELEAFYEKAPIGAAMHGPDMRYLRANKVFTEMLGKTASQIIGQHPRDIVPDVWRQINQIFKKIIKSREPIFNHEIVARIDAASEESRTWITNFFPIFIEGSDAMEIAVTAMDITTQKRLENSLAIKQDELKDVGDRILRNFEHAPFSIVIHYGPDHIIIHANKKAREILGVDNPTGMSEAELIPDIYVTLREVFDSVYYSSEMYVDDEVVINTKNAENKEIKGVFRRIVQPYKDMNGSVIGVVSINMDISELVSMRDAFLIQKDRMTSIIDRLDTQIILVDSSGKILDVNSHAELVNCFSKNVLVGETINNFASVFMDEDAVKRLCQAWKEALDGKTSRYEERTFLRTDGSVRRVIISVSPVSGRSESMSETIDGGIARAEEILITIADQTALLEATDRKDILVAELEHRVKNVIATIQAVTQFTASTATDAQTMVFELDERLAAMARTHDKLTSTGWGQQTFKDILSLEVSAYASSQSERIFCKGDNISLPPNKAMLVGLAIHELLTNAVKYGALSNQIGKVHINVQAKDNSLVRITWTEVDGPAARSPSRTGFGTLLLTEILPRELNAIAKLEFSESGILYQVLAQS